MIKVGIYGASGYMGGEALRVLSEHPEVKVVWATSRAGKPIEYFHRNLYDSGIQLIKPEEVTPCDAVFFALPSGNAMKMAPELVKQDTKIIDLGADFRLKNRPDWERIYTKTHSCWNLSEEAIYGIPELHREEIKKARIIANPGCFSSASIIGLAPLVKEGLIEVHRSFYKDDYFIKVFDIPKDPNATWQYVPYPWVAAVSGTNFCHIGLDIDEKRSRIVVFSVLDSVGKGGAHAGVQNLNLLFGLEEDAGLTRYGLHPY